MNLRLSVPGGMLAVLLVAVGAAAFAQPHMERAVAAASAHDDRVLAEHPKGLISPDADKSTTAMPSDPGSVVLGDEKTRQRYLDAMQRYYEYRASGYAYRSRVFEWQLLSSRIIFVVVLLLVGTGIYFAAVQFRAAMRAATRAAASVEPTTTSPGASLTTQFEISGKGIVINSSVMGVIILALSLAFFYLYLVYVYPITDVL